VLLEQQILIQIPSHTHITLIPTFHANQYNPSWGILNPHPPCSPSRKKGVKNKDQCWPSVRLGV
jgi:hypothetical protein